MTTKFDLAEVSRKQGIMADAKVQLKTEFFGLDKIIDRAVDSLYAWYLFPQLITRPVIVNLWGMTGVGKTQLVRRLSQLLGFNDRYVEIQMDGFSNGSGYNQNSISSILRSSAIEEGQPGIVLLDEIQRFKTVDRSGDDVKVERFQDVWMLLSDGKFSSDYSVFKEIEDMLMSQLWRDDYKGSKDDKSDEDDDETTPNKENGKPYKVRKFKLSPWEAGNFKGLLKLTEPIQEIMTWDMKHIEEILTNIKTSGKTWETDYTKLLIFISGNLDEAFSSASRTEDCDTDADIYHEMTSRISQTDIKGALGNRFKPEQISRLGNNHIIYPSLSKDSYQKLIRHTVQKYLKEMETISGLTLSVDDGVYDEIYQNSVYPTQGTRPVFSSVHKIFSTALSNIAVWAVEGGHDNITIFMDGPGQKLIGVSGESRTEVEVDLDLRTGRTKNSKDFLTMVSAHEAGHALIYALLFHKAPQEVKVNLASFTGGYMIPEHQDYFTKSQHRDRICVLLAGTVAEEMVFGGENRTNGCGSDMYRATELASNYVRKLGFGAHVSFIDGSGNGNVNTNTSVKETNEPLEELLIQEKERTRTLLGKYSKEFKEIVNYLIDNKTLPRTEFQKMFEGRLKLGAEELEIPYGELWDKFSS